MKPHFLKKRSGTLVMSMILPLMLTACGGATQKAPELSPSERIDRVLQNAANDAADSGKATENIQLLERIYGRNSDDPKAATNYAAALRKANRLQRASTILSPFIFDGKKDGADIKVEYASVQAAMGNYSVAETHARQAVELEPNNHRAHHILGIALDSQGLHKEAGYEFKVAMDNWEGDPTPIMNNMALNLAAQGFLDEAINILRRAAAIAPGRMEIERNIRIVTTLIEELPKNRRSRKVYNALVPTPDHKPFMPPQEEQAEDSAEDGNGSEEDTAKEAAE
jgi:Flp pilus assembly protein TadD